MRTPGRSTLDLFDRGDDVTEVMESDAPPRSEKREPVVRIVEYSRYPRIGRDERRQVAFTRNQSKSGLCVVAQQPEVEGTLLRVALRTVDGGAALDALAHVAWCERREDGRYWIGLALLEHAGRRMRRVQRALPVQETDDPADTPRYAEARGARLVRTA